ncbi:DNA-binding transcriptional regulator of sugar metabolism, DeoR/GlpR family [Halobacillus karajensis]|uniref:HTH-type transcriptional repressor GlcR n=1 Tax=Halobacillus karajensis TaxID=195088 RepID=A0A059NXI6_9BACI|nr:DeoR/GlpR family DNA-binding transcription regulator [Halobacillus karajensis]CDQ18433.1 HTH-type transcriptional repressor GlcR [Halobacillus karajensis]CDQ23495.1 HTH-type transcriptional repressor GlcR [Halobacillus karajensis]CDQ26977.1 HTH-type transcriptional repressor GlcR [Halobacillus karajensis]SEH51450.1 DNA-binding transcriptional regulator of sugar metabolism, DeoR/GlpR family [Halobacillus karajensis]
MYQEERLIGVIQFLKEKRRISIDQMCEMFDISRDTARRDLVKLEERKAIVRTRGGAILPRTHTAIQDYSNRLNTVSYEKQQIGSKAASFIRAGDKIILDTSTTVQACANQIPPLEVTVITNSIHQAEILSNLESVSIQLLGGYLQKEHQFLYGASVIERLKKYHVDRAFIGVVGISEAGLTIAHEEDGMVKRNMIKQAEQVIVLADHTKFGVTEFFSFADLNDVDVIITDRLPDEDFRQCLNEANVDLIVTEEEGPGIWT